MSWREFNYLSRQVCLSRNVQRVEYIDLQVTLVSRHGLWQNIIAITREVYVLQSTFYSGSYCYPRPIRILFQLELYSPDKSVHGFDGEVRKSAIYQLNRTSKQNADGLSAEIFWTSKITNVFSCGTNKRKTRVALFVRVRVFDK